MRDVGLEQIILLLIFILVPLINFIMHRVRRRPEDNRSKEQSVEPIPRRTQARPITVASKPAESRARAAASQAPTISSVPLATSRSINRALLRTPRDLRRAIIIMTILGPCRAYDPPG
jgi:cytoskeletal protein RodZ